MGSQTPSTYLMRAGGQNLLAESLAELAELIECAYDNDDHVELLLAYYPDARPLQRSDLDDVIAALDRCA
jgi:hypothetical protein